MDHKTVNNWLYKAIDKSGMDRREKSVLKAMIFRAKPPNRVCWASQKTIGSGSTNHPRTVMRGQRVLERLGLIVRASGHGQFHGGKISFGINVANVLMLDPKTGPERVSEFFKIMAAEHANSVVEGMTNVTPHPRHRVTGGYDTVSHRIKNSNKTEATNTVQETDLAEKQFSDPGFYQNTGTGKFGLTDNWELPVSWLQEALQIYECDEKGVLDQAECFKDQMMSCGHEHTSIKAAWRKFLTVGHWGKPLRRKKPPRVSLKDMPTNEVPF